jgi:hypothetical protein
MLYTDCHSKFLERLLADSPLPLLRIGLICHFVPPISPDFENPERPFPYRIKGKERGDGS